MALHLTQEEEPQGAHLENLVLHDLLTWRDTRLDRAEIFYWRTTIGEEVDFVIESGDLLLPIEVKSTTRPRLRDTVNLRTFRAEDGDKARGWPIAAHRKYARLDRAGRASRALVESDMKGLLTVPHNLLLSDNRCCRLLRDVLP